MTTTINEINRKVMRKAKKHDKKKLVWIRGIRDFLVENMCKDVLLIMADYLDDLHSFDEHQEVMEDMREEIEDDDFLEEYDDNQTQITFVCQGCNGIKTEDEWKNIICEDCLDRKSGLNFFFSEIPRWKKQYGYKGKNYVKLAKIRNIQTEIYDLNYNLEQAIATGRLRNR